MNKILDKNIKDRAASASTLKEITNRLKQRSDFWCKNIYKKDVFQKYVDALG